MSRDQEGCSTSRRSFCRSLVGVLAALGIAIGQGSKAVRRIGVLLTGVQSAPDEGAELMRERGWIEGQNLLVERRYDNGRADTLQALAEELVRAKVEIIVTGGTPATLAAKRATNIIPIVFSVGDPVLLGLVASLARPGGNLTGLLKQGLRQLLRVCPC